MTRATPQTRVWAQVLIAYEAEQVSSSDKPPTAFAVFAKLHPHLANLMGKSGARALVLRALALAYAEVPSLGTVQVNAEGGLEKLEGLDKEFDRAELAEGYLVLLARLLGLLVSFIGEGLTVQIVSEVWPDLSPENLVNEKEGKNEKAK